MYLLANHCPDAVNSRNQSLCIAHIPSLPKTRRWDRGSLRDQRGKFFDNDGARRVASIASIKVASNGIHRTAEGETHDHVKCEGAERVYQIHRPESSNEQKDKTWVGNHKIDKDLQRHLSTPLRRNHNFAPRIRNGDLTGCDFQSV